MGIVGGRLWIGLGALAGFGAVAMAAAQSHAFPGLSPAMAQALDRAVQMQAWHALALVGCGLCADRSGDPIAHAAGAAFALGVVAFCGAVYSHAIAGLSLGPVAPIGGSLLMLGWLLLFASAVRR